MDKERFRFLEHSADIYIESYGRTLKEAFQNAAIGLGFLIIESDNVEPEEMRTIEAEAENKEALLFEFLSKFLYYQDAEELIFHDVIVENIEEKNGKWHIKATAKGEVFNSEKHEQGTHVKAITYHHMEIDETKDKYRIKYLVDI
jgi:SHS2 domain-containing protein